MSDVVLTEIKNRVGIIKLNRPESLNAFRSISSADLIPVFKLFFSIHILYPFIFLFFILKYIQAFLFFIK